MKAPYCKGSGVRGAWNALVRAETISVATKYNGKIDVIY